MFDKVVHCSTLLKGLEFWGPFAVFIDLMYIDANSWYPAGNIDSDFGEEKMCNRGEKDYRDDNH